MAQETHTGWIGRTLHDRDGDEAGEITDLYYDDVTGQPEWLLVKTGWFAGRHHFVPIAGTHVTGEDLRADYPAEVIKAAPSVADDGLLTEADEQRLYGHYGFDASGGNYQARYGGHSRADEGFEYDEQPDRRTDDGDHSMVLSEEELDVHTRSREAGRVKLRKYVVTEDVDVTVPVRKQIARVVREPLSGDAPASGSFTEEEQEVVLTEEEVEVSKRAVARERVGVEVDTVTEERAVHESVRKERVDVEGAVDEGGTPRR